METLLYIAAEEMPPKVARNCKQGLKIINSGITKRNINGDLIPLRKSRKLWTRITCEDQKIPDIFVCGHSHILSVERDNTKEGMLFINPGAAGNHGFHVMKTAIKMKIEDRRVFDLAVIELGKRGDRFSDKSLVE